MPEKPQPRLYWIDALNILACFAVVVLHCTTSVFINKGDFRWQCDVLLQSLFIFAVPVFFMISGANLLGYRARYDARTFFEKRLRKVAFTLVVASIIMYVAEPIIRQLLIGEPIAISLGGFISGFLHNEICNVYWFFYAIIILYAVTPIFSLIAQNKKVLGYAIALSIVTAMVFPLLERMSPDPSFLHLFIVPYLGSWLTYFLLGYYLVHHCTKRPSRGIIIAVAIAMAVLMTALTLKTNQPHTQSSGAFSPYDNFYTRAESLFALVYATCLLLWFKSRNASIEASPLYPLLRSMSGLSLGVYAIHMLVIDTLDLIIPHTNLWDIGIRPFVVFALALALSWMGKRFMSAVRMFAGKRAR